ncbi:MAG: hypothetical protein H6917_09820 [Novosphingobium sp.]|nr:hypothetical protein [Novosphingobium sp.]MCP5402667.1 hypothetical protein [Novosphingobium sp.]
MIEAAASPETVKSVEAALREELAQEDAVVATIAPILRHFLANEANSLFSEEIIARVRGMVADVAAQLLDQLAAAGGGTERGVHAPEDIALLTDAIVGNPAFLGHVHALAVEWQLTERLQSRLGLDPVLSPLVQALIASSDAATAALAMNLLASQARFGQAQRRMTLPLGELPADLLHGALVALRGIAGPEPEADERVAVAETAIREAYDESRGRLGLISRIVTDMGAGAVAALSVGHAGVAIFLSALSVGSGQERDVIALSTHEAQVARFVLALRAAGLKSEAVEEQFLAFHADNPPPEGFERLGADHAASILAVSGSYPGG